MKKPNALEFYVTSHGNYADPGKCAREAIENFKREMGDEDNK